MPVNMERARVSIAPVTVVERGDIGEEIGRYQVVDVKVEQEGRTAWRREVSPYLDLYFFRLPRPRFAERIEEARLNAEKIAGVINGTSE